MWVDKPICIPNPLFQQHGIKMNHPVISRRNLLEESQAIRNTIDYIKKNTSLLSSGSDNSRHIDPFELARNENRLPLATSLLNQWLESKTAEEFAAKAKNIYFAKTLNNNTVNICNAVTNLVCDSIYFADLTRILRDPFTALSRALLFAEPENAASNREMVTEIRDLLVAVSDCLFLQRELTSLSFFNQLNGKVLAGAAEQKYSSANIRPDDLVLRGTATIPGEWRIPNATTAEVNNDLIAATRDFLQRGGGFVPAGRNNVLDETVRVLNETDPAVDGREALLRDVLARPAPATRHRDVLPLVEMIDPDDDDLEDTL